MTELSAPYSAGNLPASRPRRGVTGADVERVADALLRKGERPTVEKVRAALGTGSPNTINPLLDAWWRRIGQRLDAGPAALHRLPESVAHVAEALWIQALEEGRRRAALESKVTERSMEQHQETLDLRSHVLSLREGELDQRLKDRDRMVADLRLRLKEVTVLLRKEQANRESVERQLGTSQAERVNHTRRRVASKPKAKSRKAVRGKSQSAKRAKKTTPKVPRKRQSRSRRGR